MNVISRKSVVFLLVLLAWWTLMPADRDEKGRFVSQSSDKPTEARAANPDVQKFLTLAHSRFKLIAEAEAKVRAEALDDLEFSIGNQWPTDIETQRTNEGKPCITMNRLPQTIRYVTNEQRQQRPAAKINPTGSGATRELADIIQGVVRHIEVASEAEVADDTAFDAMVRCGFGWQRIITDYVNEEDETNDDQEPRIEWVRNGFSVYADPSAKKADKSDMRFAFVIEDMPEEEFKAEYPNSAMATLADFTSLGDRTPEWANKEKKTIRVAEYFYVEKEGRKRKVKWAKISALDVLEGNEEKTEGRYWPGENAAKYIPLCKVVGDDLDVNGRVHQAGLVRHMKSPMKQYNVMTSAMTQAAMLAPVAPFVLEEGQIENHEEEWRLANKRTLAALVYKGVSIAGTPAPPPQRNTAEPPVQAFAALLQRAELDLQACAGVYNPALGRPNSPDQSGKAIESLQQKSDIATLNFSDNFARTIRCRTRMLIDLIPKVIDTPRIMRIINPDGSVRHVVVHAGADQLDAAKEMLTEEIKEAFDLTAGNYDCTVSVGPSYQTKRQQAADTQLQLLKLLPPQVAQTLLDLVVRNMDIPQSDEMADRLKKQLPPQLLDDQGSDKEAQLVQAQAAIGQLTQQNQLLTKTNGELLETVKTKQIEQQTQIEKAKIDSDTKIAVAEITTKAQALNERMAALEALVADFHASAHERALSHQEHQQTLEQGAQTAAAASAQSAQDASQAASQDGGGGMS